MKISHFSNYNTYTPSVLPPESPLQAGYAISTQKILVEGNWKSRTDNIRDGYREC